MASEGTKKMCEDLQASPAQPADPLPSRASKKRRKDEHTLLSNKRIMSEEWRQIYITQASMARWPSEVRRFQEIFWAIRDLFNYQTIKINEKKEVSKFRKG